MECGSLAHRRSSGFASVSGRPSGLCHQRPSASPSAFREGQRQAQGCEHPFLAPSPTLAVQKCLRRQQLVAQAALADAASATTTEEFPRGQHWQVGILLSNRQSWRRSTFTMKIEKGEDFGATEFWCPQPLLCKPQFQSQMSKYVQRNIAHSTFVPIF